MPHDSLVELEASHLTVYGLLSRESISVLRVPSRVLEVLAFAEATRVCYAANPLLAGSKTSSGVGSVKIKTAAHRDVQKFYKFVLWKGLRY